MIPRTDRPCQTPSWQVALADAFTSPAALMEHLELERSQLPAASAAARRFGLRVPREFADRMEKGNARDPLLLQVLPVGAELEMVPGFVPDPVGDLAAAPVPGLLHKYRGRALLIATAACAINCRYCFRRHFPYQELSAHLDQWQSALDHLGRNRRIKEVILSGGDPLMMTDHRLAGLLQRLEDIPHLTRLRIHTRLPIVVPQRITAELVEMLARLRFHTVVVVHCNHPRELAPPVVQALGSVAESGAMLLNQSVLLKGVNDALEVQLQLSESLFEARVLPYYLHLLDPVQGAAHFEVSREEARDLYRQMQQHLPGYLLPRLVYEKAGAASKIPVTS